MAIATERCEEQSASVDPGARDRTDDDTKDVQASHATKEQSGTTRGTIVARLTASGALPQTVSAGTQIDLHV